MRIMLRDNGGRRSGIDRRKPPATPPEKTIHHLNERRKNNDRRICPDRRADKYREAFVREVPAQRISNYKILGFGG